MWAKIASWHRVKSMTESGRLITLCGREAPQPSLVAFPADERTCESCLRIAARKES